MEVWYYFETMVGFSLLVLPNLTCVFINFTAVFMSLFQESNNNIQSQLEISRKMVFRIK